jgi:hypothetical protein
MGEEQTDTIPTVPLTELIPDLPKHYNYQAGIDCALAGKGYRDIALAMGTTRQYLVELRQRYLPLNDMLIRARAFGLDELFDDLRYVVEDNPEIDHRKIKVKFEATKYYLACSDPRKYGDRMNIEVTEHVDLKGAMQKATSRVITVLASQPQTDVLGQKTSASDSQAIDK